MAYSHTALRVALAEDLLPLSVFLHQRGIAHRIVEESGNQVLKVSDPDLITEVERLYRAWRQGELTIQIERRPAPPARAGALDWRRYPVTLALLGLSIAGFLAFYLGAPLAWVSLLSYTPFTLVDGNLQFYPVSGQYWRLITPVFLHFGWLHIVFNSLWLWELGARVERVMRPVNTMLLFLVIALVSNVAQAQYGGEGLFGGMSGVVYGWLGFCWIGGTLHPAWRIRPPAAITLVMVGWLLACMAGLIEALGFGAIANAAHLGGLLAGMALGAMFALLARAEAGRE